jgi:hypothetical protein
MTNNWGVAHLIPAGWDPNAADADDAIEATSDLMRSHLAAAEELWALVAPERAQRLDALVLHAYSRKPPVLNVCLASITFLRLTTTTPRRRPPNVAAEHAA